MAGLRDIRDLIGGRVVLFDGAMGTMLMAEGLPGKDAPEQWNLECPEAIQVVHEKYYASGADVALTNTFGGNRLKLGKANLEGEVKVLNSRGAALAKAVCPRGKFVAGDMGPSGELIAPLGKVEPHELEEAFTEQAQALVSGGVDMIVIQTMFSLQEALAALRGVRRVYQGAVFVSMTYERKDEAFFTMMGETPEVCTQALESEGTDGIGANCTIGSADMVPLAGLLRKGTSLPVIVQPNAGKPQFRDGKTLYRQHPEEFAQDIESMIREGVNVVGGCCGTTPAFISSIYQRLRRG